MSYGNLVTQHQRPLPAHHVQHRAVLNIRARPDADVVHVAANHAHGPDAGILANRHVADDHRRRIDVRRSGDHRALTAIRANVWLSSQCHRFVSGIRRERYLIAGEQHTERRRQSAAKWNSVKIASVRTTDKEAVAQVLTCARSTWRR